DTMLRLLYRMELAPVVGLRVVGIDEWAWRKGVRYGTIVCDLESGRPVELLTEAQAETVARWLAGHPGIEVVSRDRAGMFADAAALGAPQAVQVADRWHLLRNLGDVAERVLVGLSIPPIRVEKTEPLAKLPRTTELKDRETRKDAERRQRQQRRQALYDETDCRASSTPTATTSWPVGRKVAATRRSCTVRLSSEVIRAREPSSRTLSPRCGVVRQQNLSSAACAWDP